MGVSRWGAHVSSHIKGILGHETSSFLYSGNCIDNMIFFRNHTYKSITSSFVDPATAAKSLQLCPTLCDPIDGSPPGPLSWDSPGKNTEVGCHFLLQCMKVTSESEVAQSCPTLSNPYQDPYQAPPSMGFSRQEYWSWVPLPFPFLSLMLYNF